MLLIDLEVKTELMDKALLDGIETIEEFEIWMIGYTTGFRERQDEIIDIYGGDYNE